VGAYLDRLNAEFDEITTSITELVERAAADSRDLTDDENATIERADKRRDELTPVIEHHQKLDERTNKVLEARAKVRPAPALLRSKPSEAEYDITKEFPSAGHYAVTLHRALVNKDPEAVEKIERATAHQTTADNPGIIPRPVIGPLINTMSAKRPLVASVPNRPATAPKFDRPRVDQHVDVQKQAAEKDPTASRQMKIGNVPVSLDTWAGHLNISRQDIKWTSPSILQTVFDDFARVYARQTDAAAAAEFPTLITQTAALADWDFTTIDAFLRAAYGTVMANGDDAIIDTIWMSLDVWGHLGGVMTSPNSGVKAFNLPLQGGGDVSGLNPVLDPRLPTGTLIVGEADQAEFWEDLDGFLTVDEPDVLGQMVGYAGYSDFIVLNPKAFLKGTGMPAVAGAETGGDTGAQGGTSGQQSAAQGSAGS
jgi:HK97 family phage major capsid protein